MNDHFYDGIGICLKCDKCKDSTCCPGANQKCDGENWEFLRDYHENQKQFVSKFICDCPEACAVAGPHCIPPDRRYRL